MSNQSKSLSYRLAVVLLGLAGLLSVEAFQSPVEAAARGKWVKQYQLQIKYTWINSDSPWFYSYWENVLVTEDADDASYWLQLSNFAFLTGQLNDLWPHDNQSFVAVDVRMVISSKFKPYRPGITASQSRFP